VPAEDFAGYRRIAHALDLRIVGGESHYTRWDLRPFFEDPCLPILQPDVMRGGLTELRKIAAVADTWGVRIAPHLYHELMSHLMASIPNGEVLEYMGMLDDLWVEPLHPEKGMLRPPERPGHGLAIKPELFKEFGVRD
jgi:L-alanine-DL-glutamate epimerase-like enolase superfamily enzyme